MSINTLQTKDTQEITPEESLLINTQDEQGWTALHHAANNDDLIKIKELLEAGADAGIVGYEECESGIDTPITFALCRFNSTTVEMLKLFIEYCPSLFKEGFYENGFSYLHVFCYYLSEEPSSQFSEHQERIFSLLVDAYANTEMGEGGIGTPLAYSMDFYSEAGFLGLIEKGANVNGKDTEGRTVLHNALIFNRSKAVERLLANNADPMTCDHEGWTAMHFFATHPSKYLHQISQYLIAAGSDINALTYQNETPLDLALEKLSDSDANPFLEPMIALLLTEKANVSLLKSENFIKLINLINTKPALFNTYYNSLATDFLR